jgi:hypothetical protein
LGKGYRFHEKIDNRNQRRRKGSDAKRSVGRGNRYLLLTAGLFNVLYSCFKEAVWPSLTQPVEWKAAALPETVRRI